MDEIIARGTYVEKTPYQKMVLLNECFQQMSKCKDYISLYTQSRRLLKEQLQCKSIHYLIQFKKLSDLYKAENGSVKVFPYQKETYDVVI